jgi:peptidoglycan/xylan/chitin deacetylase (PgdA/CDA1 family)
MRRLLRKVVHPIRQYLEPKALVLMYHRIAEPDTDIWNLAVAPAHFKQHLQVLQQMGNVIPAEDLVDQLYNRTLKRRSIAITFDDGYLDNYLNARPLLMHYQLPATFFIVSGNVGLVQEFWWDELAGIFLLSEQLPKIFALITSKGKLEADLEEEQYLTMELRKKHRQWKTTDEPPSLRAALFYQLWQHFKPLPYAQQQLLLQQLRAWAKLPIIAQSDCKSMSLSQLRELSESKLFTIGAHTITHPALASHAPSVQEYELATSKLTLNQDTSKSINLVAYPYGDYTDETLDITSHLGFKAAFTTKAGVVTNASKNHCISRFQVNDWNGDEFREWINCWFNHC